MSTAIRKHIGDFLAVLVLVVIALGVAGYIVLNQASRPRLPFIDDDARSWILGKTAETVLGWWA